MDQPLHTDDGTDSVEDRHVPRNICTQGGKSENATVSLKKDNPAYAYQMQNRSDGRSQMETSSRIEQRLSLREHDAAQEKRRYDVGSNLYPSLRDDASVNATTFPGGKPPPVRPVVSSSERQRPESSRNKLAVLVVVVAVMVASLAYSLSAWGITASNEETVEASPLERLRERFNGLRRLFSAQTGRLWTVSFAAVRPLLDDRPKHPAVILLAGSKRAAATTDCVAWKMSEAVRDALGSDAPVVVFDCRKYKDWEPGEVKREMDRQLTEAFGNGAGVGVVLAVESLPGNSPMIFYRFCDTANAPFKNVVLILTLNMEQDAKSDRDSEAHGEMSRLWSPRLDPEQVDPLFSRIGNSVAYVRQEADLSRCPIRE